jgi:hypothetical protein
MTLKKLNPRGFAHWIAPLAVVVVFAVVGVGYLVASHADNYNCLRSNYIEVCSNASPTLHGVYASSDSDANGSSGSPNESGSIAEYQCASNGTNCSVIAANSSGSTSGIDTSTKVYSLGHLYKACGSLKDAWGHAVTNLCTPAKS